MHSCNICQKNYSTKYVLQNHKRTIHKIFPCNRCESQFKTNDLLTEHYKNFHKYIKKSKNYMCYICNKMLCDKYNLIRHMKDFHGIFTCTKCHEQFKTHDELKFHLTKYHNVLHMKIKSKDVYNCFACGYKTSSKSNYKTHIKLVHLKNHRCRTDLSNKEDAIKKCKICSNTIYNYKLISPVYEKLSIEQKVNNKCDKLFYDNINDIRQFVNPFHYMADIEYPK